MPSKPATPKQTETRGNRPAAEDAERAARQVRLAEGGRKTRLVESELPQRWQSSTPAIKAVQVAFDVSETVMEAVRSAAFESNLSSSDQVRVILGLAVVRHAKRPRLTISLNHEDYQVLGKRFQLPPSDHLAIKERVIASLVDFSQSDAKLRVAGKRRKELQIPAPEICKIASSPNNANPTSSPNNAKHKGSAA